MYDSLTTENTKMDLKNIRFEGFYWYAKLLSFLAIAILDKDCFLAIFALLIPFLYLKKVTQKKKHIHKHMSLFDNRKKRKGI